VTEKALGALAAVTASAYIDASAWAIAGGVLVLTNLRIEACLTFADRYGAALGRIEAWCLFAAAAAARNALACSAAYAAGHLLRVIW